jgi:hypothetical protein
MIVDWVKGILVDNWYWIAGGVVGLLLIVRILFAAVEHPFDNIKRYWREAVIAALLAACAYGYNVITTQSSLLNNVEANNKVLIDNNTKLQDAVSNVNDLIGKFDQYSADTKKRFDTINGDVKNSNSALAQQLATIMKDKKPATCEEAMAYLIDANKGYSK